MVRILAGGTGGSPVLPWTSESALALNAAANFCHGSAVKGRKCPYAGLDGASCVLALNRQIDLPIAVASKKCEGIAKARLAANYRRPDIVFVSGGHNPVTGVAAAEPVDLQAESWV